jgi:hypothetical protein
MLSPLYGLNFPAHSTIAILIGRYRPGFAFDPLENSPSVATFFASWSFDR